MATTTKSGKPFSLRAPLGITVEQAARVILEGFCEVEGEIWDSESRQYVPLSIRLFRADEHGNQSAR